MWQVRREDLREQTGSPQAQNSNKVSVRFGIGTFKIQKK